MDLATLNYFAALGAIVLQAATALLFVLYLLRARTAVAAETAALLYRWAIPLALFSALLGSALTLYYSEVIGLLPCGLCWLQRAFLYPQVALYALALWTRDRGVAVYGIALSLCGLVLAVYQEYLQLGGSGVLPCPAAPGAADCAQRTVFEFGYMTFPLMAATLFCFLIVLMLYARRGQSSK